MSNRLVLFLLFFAISQRVAFPADWLCEEEASQREGDVLKSCGIGEGANEADARTKAFDRANEEFKKVCQISDDCKGHKVTVDPGRTSCKQTAGRFTCYRLLVFTIQPDTRNPPTDGPWTKYQKSAQLASPTTAWEMKKYVRTDKGFSILLPAEWRKKEDDVDDVALDAFPDQNTDDNIFVVVRKVSTSYNTRALATARALHELSKTYKDFVLEEQGDGALGSLDTHWLTFTAKVGSSAVKFMQYELISNGTEYAIVCTSTPERFESLRPLYGTVARSFRLKRKTKPAFDPSRPFTTVAKPAFDPDAYLREKQR